MYICSNIPKSSSAHRLCGGGGEAPPTLNSKPQTLNPKPKTQNPKPETRNPKPKMLTREASPERSHQEARPHRRLAGDGRAESLVWCVCDADLARAQMLDGPDGSHQVFDFLQRVTGAWEGERG